MTQEAHYCPQCGLVRQLPASAESSKPQKENADAPAARTREQRLATLPEAPVGLTITLHGDRLTIQRRWYEVGYVVGAAIAIATMIWLGWFTWQDFHDPSNRGAIAVVLGVVLWPLCLGILYWMVCGMRNVTTLVATSGSTILRHGPLWWPGGRTLGSDRLVCVTVYRRKFNAGREAIRTYALRFDYADGTHTRLWIGIHEGLLADHVALALAAFYGVRSYTTDDAEAEREAEEKKTEMEDDDE